MNQINLNEWIQNPKLKANVTLEDETEQASRLRREEATAAHERFKEKIPYILAAIVVVAIVVICAYIILSRKFIGDSEKWAMATVTLILAGGVLRVVKGGSK